jgi:putative peptidoglycan lipid II flippase
LSGKKKVAQAAGLIMVAMIVSRVLGYVRDLVIYATFGQNRITDAYNAAFSVPDFLYMLLVGGALSSAFIPVFSSYIATKREEEAWEVASIVFNLILVLMAVGIGVGVVFTPQLIKLLVPGFAPESLELTVYLTRIMFIQVVFMVFSGISMGILNSYKHFAAPAIGSVLYNLGIIVVGLFLAQRFGIAGFSFGVVAGAMLNFAVQLPALFRVGLRYKFSFNFRHPGVQRLVKLMLPVLVGLSVTQINLFVNQNLASGLPPGMVAALRTGQRLMQLPIGVFAIAIAVAVFPTLTEYAARKENREFRRAMSLGLRSIFFLALPATAGLIVLRVPIIRLLLQVGKFTAENTQATAHALLFYSIGIFAYSAIQFLSRVFYALQDTLTPVTVGVLTIILNLVLNFLLIKPLAHGGLALAYSLAGIFNMVLLLWILRKKLGSIDGGRIAVSFAKSFTASVLMGIVLYWIAGWTELVFGVSTKGGQLVQVSLSVITGLVLYSVLSLLFKMEEAEMVWNILLKKIRRTG